MNASPRMPSPKKNKRRWQLSRSSIKVNVGSVASMVIKVQIARIKISPVVLAITPRNDSAASAIIATRQVIGSRTAVSS